MISSQHEDFRRYLKNNFFGRNFKQRKKQTAVDGLIDCVDYALAACDCASAEIFRDGDASEFLAGLDDPSQTGCELVELGRLIMAYGHIVDEMSAEERELMLASQLAGENEIAKLEALVEGRTE